MRRSGVDLQPTQRQHELRLQWWHQQPPQSRSSAPCLPQLGHGSRKRNDNARQPAGKNSQKQPHPPLVPGSAPSARLLVEPLLKQHAGAGLPLSVRGRTGFEIHRRSVFTPASREIKSHWSKVRVTRLCRIRTHRLCETFKHRL